MSAIGLLPQQHSGNDSVDSSTSPSTIYTKNTDPRYLTQQESAVFHASRTSFTVSAQNLNEKQSGREQSEAVGMQVSQISSAIDLNVSANIIVALSSTPNVYFLADNVGSGR